MARTKDYDDYIDYTYDHGIDPDNYDSYDEYVDAVLKKMPPVNYNLWDRDSKKLLQSELTDFFVGITADEDVDVPPDTKRADIVEEEKEIARRWKAKSIDKSMRWQTKRMKGSVSSTDKKTIKSVKHKIQERKKFTKGERKMVRSSQMSRSWELQKKFGYSRSESMKKAAKEYRY